MGIEATPLACVGLDGYTAELLFYMIAPIVIIVLLILRKKSPHTHDKTRVFFGGFLAKMTNLSV